MCTTKDFTLIPYQLSMKTVDVAFDIGLYSILNTLPSSPDSNHIWCTQSLRLIV